MSIALFFITHEGIASNLLNIGESILQAPNGNLAYTEVPMDADIPSITGKIENSINRLDRDKGLIIITDAYGSTPSNIAGQLAKKYHADLISGVNLPMIIRLLNYRDEEKSILLKKALDGARDGIEHYD